MRGQRCSFRATPCRTAVNHIASSVVTKERKLPVVRWLKWCLPTLAVLSPGVSAAQTGDITPPAGAVTWYYECKVGDCNAKCSLNDKEVFSTGNIFGLIVMNLPERGGYWIRIEAGQVYVDYLYLARMEPLACLVTGSTTLRIINAAPKTDATPKTPA